MFDELYGLILSNNLFIGLFLTMMVCLYFLIKPLIHFWMSRDCLHTLTYWVSSTTIFVIIVGYLYLTEHSLVSSLEGMKQLIVSLLLSVTAFGIVLMVYSMGKSLSQFIRNRNTTS
ncbi:hypothetical protein [Alkalibacillus silvisoli]|uniref:Uncharacterized protein n=1 Tax=Alkalibacillus silvisoli TaxID=392823 RepID=A0ABN0ZN07_9BACI